MSSVLLKMLPTNYSLTNHIYMMYMSKQNLASNNPQGLICHKTSTKPKQISHTHTHTHTSQGLYFSVNYQELLKVDFLKVKNQPTFLGNWNHTLSFAQFCSKPEVSGT